jgi:hypothetical protein
MPNFQYGISGLLRNALSPYNNPIPISTPILQSSRVKDIILNKSHPEFEKYGGWASIGMILIEDVKQPTTQRDLNIFQLSLYFLI